MRKGTQFKMFRDELDATWRRRDHTKAAGPPIDVAATVSTLPLQALYGLSDEQGKRLYRPKRPRWSKLEII
jgi:hypothetical protein